MTAGDGERTGAADGPALVLPLSQVMGGVIAGGTARVGVGEGGDDSGETLGMRRRIDGPGHLSLRGVASPTGSRRRASCVSSAWFASQDFGKMKRSLVFADLRPAQPNATGFQVIVR